MLSGMRKAPLSRGRDLFRLGGVRRAGGVFFSERGNWLTPLGHRGYARMRGALPSNGRSPACERPRFHEGGAFGRDGKGDPAFLSGRAILSEVFIGSCGGRGLSEHGREWGFGGRIRMRSGVGGMSAIKLESLPDASACAPAGCIGRQRRSDGQGRLLRS